MLAFIDESGDCGLKLGSGSSELFTCVIVTFPDNFSADACDRAIEGLRRRLNKPLSYEFHFSHCSDKVRRMFLGTVRQESFLYAGFVVDKRRLYGKRFEDPKQFYEFAVSIVCEQVKLLLTDAKIVIDRNGDKAFTKKLERNLKATLSDSDGERRVRKVAMESSHSNNLIQLADMLCGSVARSFSKKRGEDKHKYRRLVRKNEKYVQVWPIGDETGGEISR